MKKIILLAIAILTFQFGKAQITITASDMPVAGDTLRYSFASPVGSAISPADSGAGHTWNYTLAPIRQAVDTYQTALSVNLLYFLIGPTAYGYKVADSFPLPLPGISIRQVYTFFEKKSGPARYQAQAFAANIAGIPTPINYTQPDVWYFFPLNYMNNDSAAYALSITLPTLGSLKQIGYRKSRVDGWGTITTPYYTTPVNCIRIRSEIHEIDSISVIPIPFPRNSVEYKWLVNGDHYPALWVTSNLTPLGETISSIKYRDNPLPDTTPVNNGVRNVDNTPLMIDAFPNPAANGKLTISVPADWKSFDVELFDVQAREVAVFRNERELNISALPAGQYYGRVTSGSNVGYLKFVR
jgi:Secretion system C-terminal sorting domain